RDPHVGVVDHPLGERRDPFQLLVGGVLEVGGDLAVEGDVQHRVAARLQHLLVDREQERRGGVLAVDRDDLALLHLGRVADQDLRQVLNPRIAAHPRAASLSWALVIIAMNIAWKRGSSVSSGWKAEASTPPSRIATGCPSQEARTSTPSPVRSTQGARMKTA